MTIGTAICIALCLAVVCAFGYLYLLRRAATPAIPARTAGEILAAKQAADVARATVASESPDQLLADLDRQFPPEPK